MSEDEDGDGTVADDDDGAPGGLAPGMSKAQKRKARRRNVEQKHGGSDPTKPSRQERRIRSFARWAHGGEEEDLHVIYRKRTGMSLFSLL